VPKVNSFWVTPASRNALITSLQTLSSINAFLADLLAKLAINQLMTAPVVCKHRRKSTTTK
jgi:hypothetical protein